MGKAPKTAEIQSYRDWKYMPAGIDARNTEATMAVPPDRRINMVMNFISRLLYSICGIDK